MALFDGPAPTLSTALNNCAVTTLRNQASSLGVRLPARKAEIIALICANLQGNRLKQIWAQLTQVQQYALSEAVHGRNTGYLDWTLIAAKYRTSRQEIEHGLFSLFSQDAKYIPLDLLEEMRSFVPPPQADRPSTLNALPCDLPKDLRVFSGEQTALMELEAVLRLAEADRLRVSPKTMHTTAATARLVAETLIGGDFYPPEWTPHRYVKNIGPIRAFAWSILLQTGGLAHCAEGKLQLSARGRKALAATPSTVLADVYKTWVDNKDFDEFERIESISGKRSHGGRHITAVAGRRAMVAAAVEKLPTGEWVSIDEMVRFMRGAGFDFEVTRDPWRLYIGDAQYGSLGYGGVQVWNIVNKRYLMCVLFEYMATMGLIDMAYRYPDQVEQDFTDMWGTDCLHYLSRYDGLCYLRLNALGAYCLGRTKCYTPTSPAPVSKLIYEGDEVLKEIDNGLLPADRLFLERCAVPLPDGRWRVRREMIASTLESSGTTNDIRTFFKGILGTIPDDLDFLLSEVEGGVGRIAVVGMGIILKVHSDSLAQTLSADRSLTKMTMLAEGIYLVILPGKETAVRRRLKELGFVLPRIV